MCRCCGDRCSRGSSKRWWGAITHRCISSGGQTVTSVAKENMWTDQEQLPSVLFMQLAAWNKGLIKNPKVFSRTNNIRLFVWLTSHIFVRITCVLYSVKHLDSVASIIIYVLSLLWGTHQRKLFEVFCCVPRPAHQHIFLARVKHLPAVSCGHQQWLRWLTWGTPTKRIGHRLSENQVNWSHFAERLLSQLLLSLSRWTGGEQEMLFPEVKQ